MGLFQVESVIEQRSEVVTALISTNEVGNDGLLEEAEHGTSCYLCYAQCVNFGVHGTAAVRPCSKGFTDLIEHRRSLRRGSQAR
jgi:hypothetical protein